MFSYAKMFEKSALATLLHFARVMLTHQPHVPNWPIALFGDKNTAVHYLFKYLTIASIAQW